MPFANRLCPDENLLRQNHFHLARKGSNFPSTGVSSGNGDMIRKVPC
jgi:hypothetical protein